MKLGLAVISQVQLRLFNLNLSMKPVKKFCSQMQIIRLALLHLADESIRLS